MDNESQVTKKRQPRGTRNKLPDRYCYGAKKIGESNENLLLARIKSSKKKTLKSICKNTVKTKATSTESLRRKFLKKAQKEINAELLKCGKNFQETTGVELCYTRVSSSSNSTLLIETSVSNQDTISIQRTEPQETEKNSAISITEKLSMINSPSFDGSEKQNIEVLDEAVFEEISSDLRELEKDFMTRNTLEVMSDDSGIVEESEQVEGEVEDVEMSFEIPVIPQVSKPAVVTVITQNTQLDNSDQSETAVKTTSAKKSRARRPDKGRWETKFVTVTSGEGREYKVLNYHLHNAYQAHTLQCVATLAAIGYVTPDKICNSKGVAAGDVDQVYNLVRLLIRKSDKFTHLPVLHIMNFGESAKIKNRKARKPRKEREHSQNSALNDSTCKSPQNDAFSDEDLNSGTLNNSSSNEVSSAPDTNSTDEVSSSPTNPVPLMTIKERKDYFSKMLTTKQLRTWMMDSFTRYRYENRGN